MDTFKAAIVKATSNRNLAKAVSKEIRHLPFKLLLLKAISHFKHHFRKRISRERLSSGSRSGSKEALNSNQSPSFRCNRSRSRGSTTSLKKKKSAERLEKSQQKVGISCSLLVKCSKVICRGTVKSAYTQHWLN